MEFRQIQYYDAVYRSASISRAAQNLFVTQQCISKQISMLEKELGVQLLVRKQSGVTPTEEGKWFHEHASMILRMEQDIQTHYEALRKGAPNVLRVGISNGLNQFFDDTFFHSLRLSHPGQPMQVSYMWNRQIEEMLENNTLDIGLSLLPVSNPSLYVKKLFSEDLCCIVNSSHRLAGRKVVRFEDIMGERIAMADENFNTFNSFMERCQEQGITPDVYKSSDLMSIYVYVLNHNAVGFSLNTFADRFHIDQIQHVPYEDKGGVWEVCVLMRDQDRIRFERFVEPFSKGEKHVQELSP